MSNIASHLRYVNTSGTHRGIYILVSTDPQEKQRLVKTVRVDVSLLLPPPLLENRLMQSSTNSCCVGDLVSEWSCCTNAMPTFCTFTLTTNYWLTMPESCEQCSLSSDHAFFQCITITYCKRTLFLGLARVVPGKTADPRKHKRVQNLMQHLEIVFYKIQITWVDLS